jgi:hypothetical protein
LNQIEPLQARVLHISNFIGSNDARPNLFL